jgi:tRNA dimethylallyltransferase
MQKVKHKVLVIIGPTASGKTKLAIKLAKKLNGEIISADSRQVYKGMDIGTGKDLKDYGSQKEELINKRTSIRYHLIDVTSPKKRYTLADWLPAANKAIEDIFSRGKTPIVCGGTGLYIKALIEGYTLPEDEILSVKVQDKIKKLAKLTLPQLLARLKKVDLKTYNLVDKNNRRRVQRALEIYYQTGKPKSKVVSKKKPSYDFEITLINPPADKLRKNIKKRLKERLKQGMVAEVKRLNQSGVSWKKLEEFGLEYRFISYYLRKKINKQELEDQLEKAIIDFTKRQMTWFKQVVKK